MPLTEDGLRALLDERSAAAPTRPDLLRSVHGRIDRRQRRVRATAIAAVVAVAAVVGATVPRLTSDAPEPTAGPSGPRPATYYAGGILIAGTTLRSPQHGAMTFRFTPTSWRLAMQVTKSDGWPASTTSVVTLNGHLLFSGSDTGSTGTFSTHDDEGYWAQFGVRPGRPATVHVALVPTSAKFAIHGQRIDTGALPVLPRGSRPHATVTVGVYQRIPLADYPLPPRPAKLAKLPELPKAPSAEAAVALDARKLGATGRWTRRVTLKAEAAGGTTINISSVAPGEVRVLVNGQLLTDWESWTWTSDGAVATLDPANLRSLGVRAEVGDSVTLTVEARRFTVPGWTLVAFH